MKWWLSAWLLLISSGWLAPALAQSTGQWQDSAHLWRATCAHCHGEGVAPELRGRAWTPEAFGVWMRRGPGAMPTFPASQVSDAEVAALAHWVSQQPAPKPKERP
jgi:mono/diheme cytochrome c family protein